MTTAWFNCHVGVAGDMLLAALVDAGASRDAVADAVAALGVDGYAIFFERVQRCGVGATWANVVTHAALPHDEHDAGVHGHEHDGHEHEHDEHQHEHDGHEHGHGHGHGHGQHPHRPAREVLSLIEHADLPARVAERAAAVYRRLAEVEGAIHGIPADEVELHEVGALDSIIDVVGVCAALESLGVDTIRCSSIGLGAGMVTTAHGVLPHPAPATVSLLTGAALATHGLPVTLETATPTGVALLATLAIGSTPMPAGVPIAVGYGAGTADTPGRANVVQVVLIDDATSTGSGAPRSGAPGSAGPVPAGTESATPESATPESATPESATPGSAGPGSAGPGSAGSATMPATSAEALGDGAEVVLVEANVDDVTGEVLAEALARLLDAGAHDAWVVPIVMKKGRPAHTVCALCDPARLTVIRSVMVRETGTLGVRASAVRRWPERRTEGEVDVDGHRIRVKVTDHRVKVEFDDAVAAADALGLPVRIVLDRAVAQWPTTGP